MGIKMFAAIYIGSYEVSLKIFEVASKKKIKAIDEVSSRLNLGNDAIQKGTIGYEMVDVLCDILAEFKTIMLGYKVECWEVYAFTMLREVSNVLFIQNQIYLRTGFEVKIISNSEQRFISHKSVAGRPVFEKMIRTTAAVVDIGGASIQITLFRNGQLETTQHMEVGTMRLMTLLSNPGHTEKRYLQQMEEYLNRKLESFHALFLTAGVDYVVFINDYGVGLSKKLEKNMQLNDVIPAEKFQKYIDKLLKKRLEEITSELNLPNDKDPLILPSIALFRTLVQQLDAKEIWIPGVDINDGIAYDYAERNHLVKASHNFEADIISAARNLAEYYHGFLPHIDALTASTMKIFDTIKKAHGLEKRQELLLQVATILHDCGKYVSLANEAECAYQIIISSEIIGLTHQEREIIARTVLYNILPLPPYEQICEKLNRDEYVLVAKLSAILRVANALDQSNRKKFETMKVSLKGHELVITVEAFEDISLEQALFEAKAVYFENIFSVRPILKEKRVYNYEQ